MIIIFIIVLVIIIAIWGYNKYLKRKRYLESGIEEIDKMSGEQFETCLKFHFRVLGYKVDTTAYSHDYGADLILQKDGEVTIVQAKRYNGKVGIKAVQEAMERYLTIMHQKELLYQTVFLQAVHVIWHKVVVLS
jgi:restriction system protein